MKKLLIVLLSAMFVVSGFTFVFADDGGQDSVRARKVGASFTIGGDARVRGDWKKDHDLDDSNTTGTLDSDNDTRSMDSRMRLFVVGKAGNGIEARAKMTLSSGTHGDRNTQTLTGAAGADTTADVVMTNYAYLHIPIGNIMVDAGLKERSFGKKFHNDFTSEAEDTVEIYTNLGDTNVGVFMNIENDNPTLNSSETLKDYTKYGVYVNHSMGNLAVGGLIMLEKDETGGSDAAGLGASKDGTELIVYAATDIGNIAIEGELGYQTGDLNENCNALGTACEDPMGAFVAATMPLGQISVKGTLAYAANGYTADSHFTPSAFIGTDNDTTAIANFGGLVGPGTATTAQATDEKVIGVFVRADYGVNDDIGVSGTVGYMSLGGQSGKTAGDDASAFEIDLGASYKLGDNAKYAIDLGFLMPDDLTADDTTAMSLAHKVEVYF